MKYFGKICLGLALVSLAVGASFHGYRMHPENEANYNIGVTMGIVMITAFGVFLLTGIILLIKSRKK